MPALIRSKLVLSLAAIVMIASAVVIPLSEKITQVHAAPRTAHTTLAAGDSPQLIRSLDTSGSGGSAGTNLDPAVALTFCIGYGTPNISFTPLPIHPMQATIGCDKEFFPGQSTSVDYNASNSPDFGAFVNLMTNGTSDTISICRAAVDSNSVVTAPAGSISELESGLAGFTIDFVRLVVNQVQVTSTPGPNGYVDNETQWSVTWQFWGHSARGKLFILLQGINSQLSSNDVGTTLGSVGSKLENAFPDARFFDYSYAGSQTDGTPKPYTCGLTFTNPILKDIQLLNTQITHAVGNNQNTDIYLIGHSLGGVIAFGYLALLKDQLNGVSLPAGAQLKAVVTLDSPLGGVRGERYAYFSKYIATKYLIPNTKVIPNYPCDDLVGTKTPLPTVDDSVKIYNSSTNGGTTLPDDPGNDPLGAQASIEAISGVTLPPGRPFLPTNDNLALSAHTVLGTSVLSVGNAGDYLWNPAPCSLFFALLFPPLGAIVGTIPSFTDTQFLEDQGDGSGLYGRFFNTAPFCDAATLTNGLNHNDVLTNANVLNGLVAFLSPVGATPNPLAKEPYQP